MTEHRNESVGSQLSEICRVAEVKANVGRWLTIALRFLSSHSGKIREVRSHALFCMGRQFFLFLILLPFLPIVLLMRVLRPAIMIRVGALTSNQIGPFGASTELYLCERDVGLQDNRTVDIFYHSADDEVFFPPVCNQQLRKMWERTLHVTALARPLAFLSRRLPGYSAHVIPMLSDKDPNGLLGRTEAHLFFTPEEEKVGEAGLKQLGIPEGSEFICFHARDAAYLNQTFPDYDAQYHSYRNTTIHNCIDAVQELVGRGYFAIRMGAIVEEPVPTIHAGIIDYATNGSRSDFMDIFLCARCRFFVGGAGGLNAIPRIFRRPLAFTNVVPLGRDNLLGHCSPNSLFIAKKLWLRKSDRFMTVREILESGARDFLRTEQYDALGVEVVENTPGEITAMVVEMEERLNGSWQTSEEDEELQRRFWSFFDLNDQFEKRLLRVGACFLRENQEMLK